VYIGLIRGTALMVPIRL